MEGFLEYNAAEQRYGVIDSLDLWARLLHCGDRLEVLQNGNWIITTIELESDRWYLTGTNLAGDQLRGLKVRLN